MYLGYLKLVNLHHLILIYKELKYQLPLFVKLYETLRSAGIAVEDAANLFNEAQQVPFLRNTFLDLTNANTSLQEQNNNLLYELSSVQGEVNIKRGYLQWYAEELKRFIFEIEEKKRELQYLEQLANDNMKGYARYK